MGLILNGNSPNKILYNGAEVSLYFNGSKIWPAGTPGFNEVTIGTQTWMSKNLAIDDGGTGIYTQTVNYGQGDVVEYYYTWDAAVRVANSISGWHLPSKNEWDILLSFAENSAPKLKSTYGWLYNNGTDNYNFTILPVGYLEYTNRYNYQTEARFWTTEEVSQWGYMYSFEASNSIKYNAWDKTIYSFSVRLIKDS